MAHVATGWTVIDEFCARFVYFYSGYLFASYVFALSDRARAKPALALAGLALWALVNGGLVMSGFSDWPLVSLALGFAGACAIIVMGTLLARMQWLNFLRFCGEHSIVIYLAFFLPMAATRTLLLKTGMIADIGTVSLIVTVAGVAGALVIWRLALRAARQLPVRAAGRVLDRAEEGGAGVAGGGVSCCIVVPAKCRAYRGVSIRADWQTTSARIRLWLSGSRRLRRDDDMCVRCSKNPLPRLSIRAKIPKFRPCRNQPPKPPPNPFPPKPLPRLKPGAAKQSGKGDHVFLVDGSSYIFRAYHALPPLNRKSDGLQVNAVLGFCNMLWKLLRDMPEDNRPTHLAIIFDKSEITFRNKLYPDYKAHRPPAPDDLIPQFALIREAVRAFDLPCLEQVGFEADDLIATYARLAGERGATTTIVSSDKDLMQLVTDKVTMYDTMKDRRIGIPEVIEKFGVPPEKVVEVQALAGDSTDNVPGVPGIGVKTAAQLIVEYGDLEQLLFRAGEIKQPKRREALIENAEKARISRQAGAARRQGRPRSAARRPRRARARCAQADRLPEGDGVLHPHPPRRRIFADRSVRRGGRCRQQERRQRVRGCRPAGARRRRLCRPAISVAMLPPRRRASERRQGATSRTRPRASKGTPISLAAAREEAARKLPVDRSKYQTIRNARSNSRPGSRAPTMPAISRSTPRPTRSIRCRPTSAASRWRWRRTTPATCRSPTSSPAAARACSTPASRRTRSRRATRSPR